MDSNPPPSPPASATTSVASKPQKDDDDETLARKLHAIEQLTTIFRFERSAAQRAVDAVGTTDLQECCNYILEQGMGQDQGGPVTPIETCPHLHPPHGVVKIRPAQLPLQHLHNTCAYYQHHHNNNNNNTNPSSGSGNFKSDDNDATIVQACQEGENWCCLTCGAVCCSRYINGHAAMHWDQTTSKQDPVGHCVAVSLADLSVWCYACESYVRHDYLLRPITRALETIKFGSDDYDAGEDAIEEDRSEEGPDRKKARTPQEESSDEQDNDDEDEDDDEEEAEEDSDGDGDGAIQINLSGRSEQEVLVQLAQVAAAQGIPLNFLLSSLMEDNDDDDDSNQEPIEYPFGTLPTSLEEVAQFIQSDKCNSILILAGAGMSVASGIPDFRSADGLYATMNPDLLTATPQQRQAMRLDPTAALEQGMFLDNPLPCLELQREFILGTFDQRWKATLAHRFVELLHAKTGKLVRLYTQNIDGLEDQCEKLPRDKVIAVHGSMDRAECARCSTESDFGQFCRSVKSQIKDITGQDPDAPKESKAIECHVCGYAAVKPAIVLFRSSLPRRFFECVPRDTEGVDLLIVIGTSLKVAPANSLVWRVPRSALRVLVNREMVGRTLGMDFERSEERGRDFFAEGDCDDVLLELMEHLGWLDDLAALVEDGKLPDSSAKLLEEKLTSRNSSD